MVTAIILGLIAGVFIGWFNVSNHELMKLDMPLILDNSFIKLLLIVIPIALVIFSFIQFGIIAGIVAIVAAFVSHSFVWVRAENKMKKLMRKAEDKR